MSSKKRKANGEDETSKIMEELNAYACECGIDTVASRAEAMQPQCGFGELGLCCRICLQGPCRINPFRGGPKEGICGAKDYTIVSRNIIRMIAAGCAAHSDHGRHLIQFLNAITLDNPEGFKIKGPGKLQLIAEKMGIDTKAQNAAELAKKLVSLSYNDFTNQDDRMTNWLRVYIPEKRKNLFDFLDVVPTNIDRGITEVMHRTNVGCDADPVPLMFGGIKCSLGDLTGENMSTGISDILFGIPAIVKSEANLGVLKKNAVNIVVHGHNPILSEIIVDIVDEMNDDAVKAGATDGIRVSGICCTANELLMRRGIPIVTNFLTQDLAILTGVVDAMVVDYQCIMPAVSIVARCYHTKLISTHPMTRIPGDIHIEFDEKNAKTKAREIVRIAIEAFKHRDQSKIRIPEMKQTIIAGFSVEAIKEILSKMGTGDPLDNLVQPIRDGRIRGIALMVGCNNHKTDHDGNHVTIAMELLKNNILVLATGCAAQAYAKYGLLSPEATEKYAGNTLKEFLKELSAKAGMDTLPPVWHMGSCVDNSRPQELISELADRFGSDIRDLPIVASAPEAMSEKSIAIGTWTVAMGWPTHVGVYPFINGSPLVKEIAARTAKDVFGGFFVFDPNPETAAKKLVNVITYRRWQMGLDSDADGIYCYGNTEGDVKPLSREEIFKMAIDGAIIATGYAEVLLNRAIRKYGSEKPISYPDTGYGLPCIDAWSGIEVKKLGDLPALLGEVRSKIFEDYTFENAKAAGESVLYSAEIVEALKYIDNENPYNYPQGKYCGFVGDRILRKLGFGFVDDTIPGAVVLVGKAKDSKSLVKIVKDCQNKGMLIIAAYDIIKQLEDEHVQMGLDLMLYPVGEFTQVVHGASFATRAALTFGGIKRGQRKELYEYLVKRPKTFVLQLGPLDHIKAAAEFGVIFMGSPTITDQPVEEITDPDDQNKIWYSSEPDYDKILQKAIEIRGCRIKLEKIPIPIAYGPAFEGESIRKEDMFIEAGGMRSPAFEYLKMKGEQEVNDGKITLIGKDVNELQEGSAVPLAILVEVYGRKMQKDFEGVLERRIHQFINFAEGVMHLGQRNTIWIRLSKNAVKQGMTLKLLGEILVHRLHQDFAGIVNRVQVTIITDESKVKEILSTEANMAFDERDTRLRGLVDEKVDTFYSCTLCQSFAPNHVCVVTPERLGLCGAVNWLDAKASYEISAVGPNQPLLKGPVVDIDLGQWQGINEKVKELSHGKLERFSAYSIINDPMTSCGCFECIIAIVPEANGVLVVNREYAGDTPIGMKFSTLAGSVGGGNQVPGFLGIGRKYLLSKKFINADGGFQRIVWMPSILKEQMKDMLTERAKELGIPEFIGKIADENIAKTTDELVAFLQKVDHPAIKMRSLI